MAVLPVSVMGAIKGPKECDAPAPGFQTLGHRASPASRLRGAPGAGGRSAPSVSVLFIRVSRYPGIASFGGDRTDCNNLVTAR